MLRLRNRLFRSKLIDQDNDILTYHFKEQCKLQQQINATIPSAKSLFDQPSVRVKANGVIVLNKHHSSSLDWVPTIISEPNDDDESDELHQDEMEEDDAMSRHSTEVPSLLYNPNPDTPPLCTTSDSFLSAPPRRNQTPLSRKYYSHPLLNKSILPRCVSLPLVEPSTLLSRDSYECRARILMEDLKRLQLDGDDIKQQYYVLKRQCQEQS